MKKNKNLSTVNGNHHVKLFILAVALMLVLTFSRSASATMIGSWDVISAPTSASMLTGATSGYLNNWINTANTPISVNDALSGPNILDAGIANLSNSVFQLTFESGTVVNNAGDDLVLFDGRFDAGVYAISSSYDNFSNRLAVAAPSFINTGESRGYYMENCPYPTSFSAGIYGASIDLSLLGIPEGAGATDFRVWSLNGFGSDFIGLGSLTPAAHAPEPATMLLFGAGLAGFGVFRKKFAK